MGYLMHFNNKKPSYLEQIGHKVKNAAELAGTIKSIWETGKAVYAGFETIAPYIGELGLLAGI